MRAIDATVLRLVASTLMCAVLGCKRAPRVDPRPADAGTVVTVYLPAKAVDRLMGRLQTVAARRQWVLSLRTDNAARAEADLAIVDSGGTLAAHVRAGSPAAAQAKQMAEAVLP
jgi:hypothetical protein